MELRQTAVHEAGHAIAFRRAGIEISHASIILRDDTAGRVLFEDSIHCLEDAWAHALASCAGYASCFVVGFDERDSAGGCQSDFEEAQEIIRQWNLEPLEHWKAQAVGMLSSEENRRAIEVISRALMQHQTIGAGYVDVLIEWADGACTDEDLLCFESMAPDDYWLT